MDEIKVDKETAKLIDDRIFDLKCQTKSSMYQIAEKERKQFAYHLMDSFRESGQQTFELDDIEDIISKLI